MYIGNGGASWLRWLSPVGLSLSLEQVLAEVGVSWCFLGAQGNVGIFRKELNMSLSPLNKRALCKNAG